MKQAVLALCVALLLFGCSGRKPEAKEDANLQKRDANVVEMGLEAQKHVGLQVAPASVNQLTEYIHVTGTVQPIDSRIGQVRPLAKGRIQDVLVKVGDRVGSGQPLALFDNIEAGELAAQYEAGQAELEKLKIQQAALHRQVERYGRLSEIGAVSQKEFELAQAEQRGLLQAIKAQESMVAGIASRLRRFGLAEMNPQKSATTTIRSPFAGVLIKTRAAAGEVVDTGAELFSIADLSQVWVQAEVYEKDLGRIHLGQIAFISVDTYPGVKFSGRVTYISDILDPQTRTAKVRCEVRNRDVRLKLDMFASVDVPTTFSRKAVAVPTGAIQQVEGKQVVFVRRSAVKFEAREIKVGKAVDGQTEIATGLAGGEPVVTRGAFHLKSILLGGKLGEE